MNHAEASAGPVMKRSHTRIRVQPETVPPGSADHLASAAAAIAARPTSAASRPARARERAPHPRWLRAALTGLAALATAGRAVGPDSQRPAVSASRR